MSKSLFEDKTGIPSLLPVGENEKIHIEEKKLILDQNQPIIPEEKVIVSGAFFLRGEEMFADIRLELNVKHPKYHEYYKRFKDLVKEAEKDHVLLSSSGI